jgi:hypothetical protein
MILGFCASFALLKGEEIKALDVWGFNEGKGNIFVNSAGAYGNGKLFGDFIRENGAVKFNGKNAYGMVKCASKNGKSVQAKCLSLYCRFKVERLPEKEYFTIASSLENTLNIKLHGRKNETWIIVSWLDPETGNRLTLTSGRKKRDLKPGEWLQFLFSINGERAKLFVNGELDMYDQCYLVKKGEKKGENIAFDKNNGFPYKGDIRFKGLTFGVDKRGNTKRHWMPGSIASFLIFDTGLGVKDIPAIKALLDKSSSQKILETIDL